MPVGAESRPCAWRVIAEWVKVLVSRERLATTGLTSRFALYHVTSGRLLSLSFLKWGLRDLPPCAATAPCPNLWKVSPMGVPPSQWPSQDPRQESCKVLQTNVQGTEGTFSKDADLLALVGRRQSQSSLPLRGPRPDGRPEGVSMAALCLTGPAPAPTPHSPRS